jgi:serine/threonine protein kinase
VLGKGSYGEVELARIIKRPGSKLNPSIIGKMIAVKRIDKRSLRNEKIQKSILREVEIHNRIEHENIIRLYNTIEHEHYIYLMLELAEKGNLFFLIR